MGECVHDASSWCTGWVDQVGGLVRGCCQSGGADWCAGWCGLGTRLDGRVGMCELIICIGVGSDTGWGSGVAG